ncbi:unnamed protein product [Brugia pahangi]|uniref:40S ribosomal protein S4 n=1 Tax=Brugia pahangi TaxID=6280 RepID=A0A0N4T7Z2_BRUPA|nr:unnamed protein product [Brugia pahangi]
MLLHVDNGHIRATLLKSGSQQQIHLLVALCYMKGFPFSLRGWMREREKDEQNGVEGQTDRMPKDTSKSKDWAAADLEKVTDFNEDSDIGREVSNEKLDSLISGPSGPLRESGKVINVKKEDVLLIVSYDTDKSIIHLCKGAGASCSH